MRDIAFSVFFRKLDLRAEIGCVFRQPLQRGGGRHFISIADPLLAMAHALPLARPTKATGMKRAPLLTIITAVEIVHDICFLCSDRLLVQSLSKETVVTINYEISYH